jgi:hypothetical protein
MLAARETDKHRDIEGSVCVCLMFHGQPLHMSHGQIGFFLPFVRNGAIQTHFEAEEGVIVVEEEEEDEEQDECEDEAILLKGCHVIIAIIR